MASKNPKRIESTVENVPVKKNKAFLYATVGFLVAILFLSCIIGFVVVPILNKNLSKMGINSINEFIGFYQDLNRYVDEDDIVKNGFSSTDYSSAYNKLTTANLNVFSNDETVSSLSLSKIEDEEFDYSLYSASEPIELTSNELASLLANSLENDLFIDRLGIDLINKYSLELEIKELTVSKNQKYLVGDCFNLCMVGRISLDDVAKDLPWPFNGMLPNNVYVLVESVIHYTDTGVEYLEYGININNMTTRSHEIAVNVINSQIEDKQEKKFTLQGFSEDLNKVVYNRIEKFADKLHSTIRIVEKIDLNGDVQTVFELKYKA